MDLATWPPLSHNHKLELLREREVLRLVPQLFASDSVPGSSSGLESQSTIQTALTVSVHDPVLTALAQLGAIKLNVRRCLVSVFDRRRQLIISEATTTSSFADSTQSQHDIWLGGTAIPRSHGICEHLLFAAPSDPVSGHDPISVVPDLSLDPRFCNRPYIIQWPFNRFYAGIPLVSRNGVRYGVLCVFDDRPHPNLSDQDGQVLRDLCQTMSTHLESYQPVTSSTRGERMIRGFHHFFEGKTTLSRRHSGSVDNSYSGPRPEDDSGEQYDSPSHPDSSPPSPECQKRPPPVPLQSPTEQGMTSSSHVPTVVNSVSFDTPTEGSTSSRTIRTLSSLQDPISNESKAIFGRAANIIRDSVEVDGVVFLDACISSFGGLVLDEDGVSQSSNFTTPVSSADEPLVYDSIPKSCRVLGFSMHAQPSTGQNCAPPSPPISEKTLQALLNRYPTGAVFNFDEDGRTTDSTEDDYGVGDLARDIEHDMFCRRASTPCPSGTGLAELSPPSPASQSNDAKVIGAMFRGARSVLLVPLWNTRKEKWFAGGFMWTNDPARCFSFGAEMSYLRAFATTIMSDVDRLDTVASERAKSDLLGSLSHELRSPLHGIVAALEMLQDTKLDAFQAGLLQTMDCCGHTLVGVIDHLLDYSKITIPVKPNTDNTPDPPAGTAGRDMLKTFDPSTVASTVIELDALVEETVESVFSGLQFRSPIDDSANSVRGSDIPRRQDLSRSNSVWSSGSTLSWASDPAPENVNPSAVSVFLECDPQASWSYRVDAGALRRLIMNLLGNALKFTDTGFIKVSIRQEQRQRNNQARSNHLLLDVIDSGRGMDPEFLRHRSFQPFSQEDPLSQGTGLGLSLVREIVQTLHGSLHMESQLSRGTSVTVAIPLGDPLQPSLPLSSFWDHVLALKSLRVGLHGFRKEAGAPGMINSTPPQELDMMIAVCRDRLNLEVVPPDATDIRPDIILCAGAVAGQFMANTDALLPPVVAICDSAVAAHTYLLKYREGDQARVFQTISQPVGPRKLANALVQALGYYNNAKVSELVRPPQSPPQTKGVSFLDSLLTPDFVVGSEFPFMADLADCTLTAQMSSQQHGSVRPQNATLQIPQGSRFDGTTNTVRELVTESVTRKLSNLALRTDKLANQDDPTDHNARSQGWIPIDPYALSTKPVPRNQFLLVDDNNINIQILVSFMKKLGRPYQTATNGLEALKAYSVIPCPFSHVLMDISMPVMDGLESTRLIRQFERMQHLVPAKIIALTGLASAAAQKEAFASGVDVYKTKPARFKDLAPLLSD